MARTNDTTRDVSKTERLVGWIGRIGAPIGAIVVYLLLGGSELSEAGRATAAVGVLMAMLWMTEAIPLPATSLMPIFLFPLLGVSTIREATTPFANELIFLFMGGFMLALTMERWNLHKRIALLIVALVGTKPMRLIGGFMLASAVLSMWISNSATAVMMLPIGASVITLVEARLREDPEHGANAQENVDRFGVCLMLGLAYAASIGGVATIIGTPPNVFLVSFLQDQYDIEVSFAKWMLIGLPFSATFLVITWVLLTRVLHRVELKDIPGGKELIRDERRALGPMSRGEWTVLVVFLLTATLWIIREPLSNWEWFAGVFPPITQLTDPGVAVFAAILLFVLPVDLKKHEFALDWPTAVKLPWGVLLLFGGGLSLAAAVGSSGLDEWIGSHVGGLEALPMVVIIGAVVTLVVFLTELTSNTATSATFLPILAGVAVGIGAEVPMFVIPAAIAASCAFMMPVATPPNAIVFGSDRIRIGHMVKAGLILNIIGIGLITLLVFTVDKWALSLPI